jgi:hypothetical protein
MASDAALFAPLAQLFACDLQCRADDGIVTRQPGGMLFGLECRENRTGINRSVRRWLQWSCFAPVSRRMERPMMPTPRPNDFVLRLTWS